MTEDPGKRAVQLADKMFTFLRDESVATSCAALAICLSEVIAYGAKDNETFGVDGIEVLFNHLRDMVSERIRSQS